MNAKLFSQTGFIVVMNCAQADSDYSLIAGAEKRISLPYEDPKIYDHTPQAEPQYQQTSKQIATELFYVFSHLNAS